MLTRSRPTVDASYVFDLLLAAKQQMSAHDSAPDLSEKVTVVKVYFELSRTSPEANYGPVLGRAVRELSSALRREVTFLV